VANVHWGAGAVERKDLELPLDRDGGGHVAHGFVAGLILELAREREGLSIFTERSPELGAGADFYILTDAEGAFVDGHFFLDGWQIESFGCGVDCRAQLEIRDRVDYQFDGLVALRAGGVYVNIGGQVHFGGDCNARAGNAGAIGLLESELEVRGFDGVRDFLAQLGEEFRDDAVASQTLAVFGFEEFFLDDAVGINEEIAGASKTLLHAGGFVIEDAVGFDDFGIGIREHRILDFVTVGEEFQDFLGVIADGGELDALLFEPGICALQLDQLPFAEGSPVCRTEEEKDCAVRAFQCFEGLHAAEFVAGGKIGGFLADGKADGHQFGGGDLDGVVFESSADGDGVAEMGGYFLLRLERVHEPVGVVVESNICSGNVFEALGRFVESFVGVAGAGYEDAGPGASLRGASLSGEDKGCRGKNRAGKEERALHDRIDFSPGHRFLLFNSILDADALYAPRFRRASWPHAIESKKITVPAQNL
jgi:hypothetical protein